MAHGRLASMCASRLSLVPVVAASVHAIASDVTHHHLDGKHHSHVPRVASAGSWASVGASRMGRACGVWLCRADGTHHHAVCEQAKDGRLVTNTFLRIRKLVAIIQLSSLDSPRSTS